MQDMNVNAVPLLGQLNGLLKTAKDRVGAFIVAQKAISYLPTLVGGPGGTPSGNIPALKILQEAIVAENLVISDLNTIIIRVTNWALNDPTYAAQGRPLTQIDPETGETIPDRPVCPNPKPSLLVYLRSYGSDPANPDAVFVIPAPYPTVTEKPGAPAGGNSPFGVLSHEKS